MAEAETAKSLPHVIAPSRVWPLHRTLMFLTFPISSTASTPYAASLLRVFIDTLFTASDAAVYFCHCLPPECFNTPLALLCALHSGTPRVRPPLLYVDTSFITSSTLPVATCRH